MSNVHMCDVILFRENQSIVKRLALDRSSNKSNKSMCRQVQTPAFQVTSSASTTSSVSPSAVATGRVGKSGRNAFF